VVFLLLLLLDDVAFDVLEFDFRGLEVTLTGLALFVQTLLEGVFLLLVAGDFLYVLEVEVFEELVKELGELLVAGLPVGVVFDVLLDVLLVLGALVLEVRDGFELLRNLVPVLLVFFDLLGVLLLDVLHGVVDLVVLDHVQVLHLVQLRLQFLALLLVLRGVVHVVVDFLFDFVDLLFLVFVQVLEYGLLLADEVDFFPERPVCVQSVIVPAFQCTDVLFVLVFEVVVFHVELLYFCDGHHFVGLVGVSLSGHAFLADDVGCAGFALVLALQFVALCIDLLGDFVFLPVQFFEFFVAISDFEIQFLDPEVLVSVGLLVNIF